MQPKNEPVLTIRGPGILNILFNIILDLAATTDLERIDNSPLLHRVLCQLNFPRRHMYFFFHRSVMRGMVFNLIQLLLRFLDASLKLVQGPVEMLKPLKILSKKHQHSNPSTT